MNTIYKVIIYILCVGLGALLFLIPYYAIPSNWHIAAKILLTVYIGGMGAAFGVGAAELITNPESGPADYLKGKFPGLHQRLMQLHAQPSTFVAPAPAPQVVVPQVPGVVAPQVPGVVAPPPYTIQ